MWGGGGGLFGAVPYFYHEVRYRTNLLKTVCGFKFTWGRTCRYVIFITLDQILFLRVIISDSQ